MAIIADPSPCPTSPPSPQGTAEYPDRSATLILQVQSLDGGGPGLVLDRPGNKWTGAHRAAARFPTDFVARMRANRALFPRGIDLFLVAGNRIVGLPRSTRVEAA